MDLKLLQKLLDDVDTMTYHKGMEYFSNGKVLKYILEKKFLTAAVQGLGSNRYRVNFSENSGKIDFSCTCPLGYFCKHLVAVALTILHNDEQKHNQGSKNNLLIYEKNWINQLKKTEETPSLANHDVIAYVINVAKIDQKLTDSIQICSVIPKQNGKFSKPSKKYSFSSDNFSQIPFNMKDSDQEITTSLIQAKYFPIHESELLFRKIIDTGMCFWKSAASGKALKCGEKKEGLLEWEHDSQLYISPKAFIKDSEAVLNFIGKSCFYIDYDRFEVGLIEFPCSIELVKKFLTAPRIHSSRSKVLQNALNIAAPTLPPIDCKIETLPASKPIPCMNITVNDGASFSSILTGSVTFEYGNYIMTTSFGSEDLHTFKENNIIYQLPRNAKKELKVLDHLLNNGWYKDYYSNNLYSIHVSDSKNHSPIFILIVEKLRKLGWKILGDEPFLNNKVLIDPQWYGEVSEIESNWFDLEIGSVIDRKRVNLIEVLSKLMEEFEKKKVNFNLPEECHKQYIVPTQDGDLLIIPFERMKGLFNVFLNLMNYEKKGGKVQFSHAAIPSLSSLENENSKLVWQTPKAYQDLKNKFQHFTNIEKVTPPQLESCDLRPYQIDGLSWMQFLAKIELGGILADDMGLGKTVQTIAHIVMEKNSGRMTKPALIVAPTSLMGNWLLEVKKFAPTLSVLILQGIDRKVYFQEIQKYDIVLTTYPLLVRDDKFLLDQEFYFLILDEAQMIKNAKTKAHQVLRNIKAKHKLCLTGTPMENHLGELWSLFHIILPGYLGSEKQFQSIFRKPIEKCGSIERKNLLKKRIDPFLLRRTKEEVTPELPPKTEILVPIELSQVQKDLYEAVRLTMMKKVLAHVQEKGLAQSHIVLLDALLKLRQICCDPRLLKNISSKAEKTDSSKLSFLVETIPQMIEENRQILLFSQFTSMLSLIEQELKRLKIPYVILTGETKDRLTPIEAFQSGKVKLFLISLKAGGTGLNLTSADTVIHYDPWWNPQVENQATARAHRIGQTKPIFVYKWIASGSIEEKIIQMQERKKVLIDGLLEGKNNKVIEWKQEDIETLFSPLESFVQA